MSDYVTYNKGLALLEMSERERRAMGFLVNVGWRYEWKSSVPNFYKSLAFYMGWNEDSTCKAFTALIKRGWVDSGTSEHSVHWLSVSDAFYTAAERAVNHYETRAAFGTKGWAFFNPYESDVDAIIARAVAMRDGKLKARLKKVYREMCEEFSKRDCPTVMGILERLPAVDNTYLALAWSEEMGVEPPQREAS